MGLANAYGLLSGTYYDSSLGITRDSLIQLARSMAIRAFRADSTAAESWAAMAYWQQDPAIRRAYAERAMALDPHNPDVLYFYSNLLASVGDEEGSVLALQRAVAADPTRPVPILSLGMYHLRYRRFAEALRWLDLALLAARRGDSVELRSLAAALETAIASQACAANFDCVAVAGVLVAAGERDRALVLLERSKGRGAGWMLGWLAMAEFDPLRSDPRFQAIIAPQPRR